VGKLSQKLNGELYIETQCIGFSRVPNVPCTISCYVLPSVLTTFHYRQQSPLSTY